MIFPRKPFAVALALAFVFALMVSSGCTKYASPDDLQKLDEAKQAAVSAEKELDRVKAERKKVEKVVAEKEQELQAAQAELERAKAP